MSPMNVRGENKTRYKSDWIHELVTSAMSERGTSTLKYILENLGQSG